MKNRSSPALKAVDFTVEKISDNEEYYGFEVNGDHLYLLDNGLIMSNSGKSVAEQSIVGHVSRYSDNYQLVGVDCKRVEFNLLRGVKGVKGVALDVKTAAATIAAFQQLMMDRFKFMENSQVNNVYKIRDKEVDYYEFFGRTYQFDEIFELMVDLDEKDRDYSKLIMQYPDGRQPIITTIDKIYKGLQENKWKNPALPQVKGYNPYISIKDIRKTKGIYRPKALIFLADELNELMNSDDYKSVDTVKQCLGSIARLGRAAGTHLALAAQRASSGTINSDLKNNIQMSLLLGGFDSGASTLMFEKDISNLAKPEIKGRGFLQSGNQIIEVQTYYTQPENDWVFDEEMKVTYDNPVYLEQKKRRNETVDESGFVVPKKLSEIEEEKNKKEDLKVEDFVDTDDEDDEIDDFFDDDSDPIKVAASKKESLKKPESEKPKIPERPERPNRPERPERSNKEPIKQESIKQEPIEKVTPIIEKPKKVEQVIKESGSKQQIINESKQENKNIFNNDESKTKPKQVFRESNAKPKFNFKKKD